MSRYTVAAPDLGVGEIEPGTDLAALIAPHVSDGAIVVIASKVVSKAEGRASRADRDSVITAETVRTVARRGDLRIVENRLGLVMAAAGVDESNLPDGVVLPLPLDPDASARALRESLAPNVAVIVADTAGRAWREGQTDIAIGVAGLEPLAQPGVDWLGKPLLVTLPAIADELAGAAEVACGKATGRPVAVITGLDDLVLPRGEHGAGGRSVVRDSASSLFGLGAREAVITAVAGHDPHGFGEPAPVADVLEALARCGWDAEPAADGAVTLLSEPAERLAVLLLALGWELRADTPVPRLVPVS